jgi:CPA2 family monovalent cation:H+ antiporter-2
MVITPFVLRNISFLANLILRDNEVQVEISGQNEMHDHIIVLGYGRLGRKICEKLDKREIQYIAIENNIYNVKEAQKESTNVLFGNAANKTILESVNIKDSAVVIVALDNAEKLHLICDVLTQVVTSARVIIKVDRFKEKDDLTEEFPDYEILVGTEQMARGMVDSVLKCEV